MKAHASDVNSRRFANNPIAGCSSSSTENYLRPAACSEDEALDIAHGLEARPTGKHRWMARCPAHDDRVPSLSIAVGSNGPLIYCHAGCTQDEVISALRVRGLWKVPGDHRVTAHKRHDDADELWRSALSHLAHGTPLKWPPYTRSLPVTGAVWIVCGPNAWPAAKSLCAHSRHALVWPYGRRYIPFIAYRWPVKEREVVVMDTDDALVPDYLWNGVVEDFGRHLVSRWHARSVCVFGDFEPVAYRAEVRDAV